MKMRIRCVENELFEKAKAEKKPIFRLPFVVMTRKLSADQIGSKDITISGIRYRIIETYPPRRRAVK